MTIRQYPTQVTTATPVVTTTETVVLTTVGVSTSYDGDPVVLSGSLDFTEGTGGTAYTIRCRRGTGITGTVVGAAEVDSLAAASQEIGGFSFEDVPGAVAGQQYVITVQQTAATGNGSCTFVECTVSVGS